jgi:iron complex outermembrane recepter protein
MKKYFILTAVFGSLIFCSFGQISKDTTIKLITTPISPTLYPWVGLPKPKVLDEVQVIAIRGNDKSPFAKTTIPYFNKHVGNLGQDIPFLLNLTPSVIINSDAGNGVGYTGIRIRGTDATRINMTINGIPYNDAESQGLFFVNLPDFASSVSSVQVQRGVGSSSNGAGAFGASMSFSTNELIEKPTLEFNNSFGSFNTTKSTLKLSTGLQKRISFDGRLSQIKSDGFIDRASSNLKSAMTTLTYVHKNTNIKFNTILGKEKTYQAWYGIAENDLKNNRRLNSAGTERPNEPYTNEVDHYNQNHLQLIWNQKINKLLKFSTASFYTRGLGYYEQYKANASYSSYGLPNYIENGIAITETDLIRQLWLDNHFYGQTFSFIYDKNKSTNFTIGGMLSQYDGKHYGQVIWANKGIAKNYKWYDLTAHKKDRNIYAKWFQKIAKKWSMYSDIQYRNVQYNVNGFRNNPTLIIAKKYSFFNPKFGFVFTDASSNSNASISYAKGAKEPNREDFEANGNQLPLPEKLHNIEFAYNKKFSNKVAMQSSIYYMLYKDQLINTGKINDVGAYTRQNVDNSTRAGVELQLSYNPTPKLSLSGNITFSQNKIKSFTEYIDDYDNGGQIEITHVNTTIAFSPNVISAVNIHYNIKNNLYVSLASKYVSKQYLDNTQNDMKKLNAYFTQDFLFSFSPKFKKIAATNFILQVNNIFNKKYEPNGYTFSYKSGGTISTQNFYYPMAGVNFMLGVNIKLQK